MNTSRRSATLLLVALLAARANPATAQRSVDPALIGDGSIVLLRHAEAPGVGDPPNFVLGDCGTQRNLGDAGRDQAKRIGERWRGLGMRVTEVRTSQWCRTRDTARLAFPQTKAQDDPDFNSFFGDAGAAPDQTARALATLRRWRGPGTLVIVTHQVNITALTGAVPSSGEGLVVRIAPAASSGSPTTIVTRLPAP